jgi:hypothetical protein
LGDTFLIVVVTPKPNQEAMKVVKRQRFRRRRRGGTSDNADGEKTED